MFLKSRKLLLDQNLNDFLVNSSPQHMLEVVHRHDVFYDAGESPESLFFGHYLEKSSYDKVETLTVADVHVFVGVYSAHTLDRFEDLKTQFLFQGVLSCLSFFVIFEKGLIWEGPRHVYFDLVTVGSWILLVESLQ